MNRAFQSGSYCILGVRIPKAERNHCLYLGDHADLGHWFENSYGRALRRARALALAEESVGGRGYRYREKHIEDVGLRRHASYIGFIGTILLFVAAATLSPLFPGTSRPQALSTTAALATCVFSRYRSTASASMAGSATSRSYLKPMPIMLPFNIISEFSGTLALAVRLFGNMMSGTMIPCDTFLTITPFIFPAVMGAFGLLTGLVQAYIFSILADSIYCSLYLE